jgi:predicted  nucleic acid-binding Zn-ribbon protein
MFKALTKFLDIQELDMQMIRLMRLKAQRKKELEGISALKEELRGQVQQKQDEIRELKKDALLLEGEVADVAVKLKKLESQQSSIKKVDEFNALSQEMAHADRERMAKEQRLSDLLDRVSVAEDTLKIAQEKLDSTVDSRKILEVEIYESILRINEEGRALKKRRDELVSEADPDIYKIYERLLKNKKDRVLVPIENRCCSGCHIMLTAQDENLVRKGERLVFCEHCSRIHYWQESQAVEGSAVATKQRRRRAVKA